MNETDRTRAVEAMARAMWEQAYPSGNANEWDTGEREFWEEQAAAALDALLSLRTEEPCPVCWGRVNDIAPGATCKNPECSDGTTPGVPLVFTADQPRAERDEARAVADDAWAWVDKALAALGVATVFDIPPARSREHRRNRMTPHTHREHVEGCFRCDLSRDEERRAAVEAVDERYRLESRIEDLEGAIREWAAAYDAHHYEDAPLGPLDFAQQRLRAVLSVPESTGETDE